MHIETEAGRRSLETQRATQIKLIVTTIVALIGLILIFKFFGSSNSEHVEDEDSSNPSVVKSKGMDQAGKLLIPGSNATIHKPAHWIGDGNTLRYLAPGIPEESTILMKVIRNPNQTELIRRRDEIKQGTGLPDAKLSGAQDVFSFVDGVFACSEVTFKYTRDNSPYSRFYYLVQGPNDAVFQVEFDGPDSVFDLTMQGQVREIMRSWTYSRK